MTDRLRASSATWALSGTGALAAHGIDVTFRDLDVVTTKDGAHEIAKLLAEFLVIPVALTTRGNIRAHLGVLRIDGCEVDVLGDVRNQLQDGRWTPVVDVTPQFVTIASISRTVPLLPLRQLLAAYQNMGRPQTASLIVTALAL